MRWGTRAIIPRISGRSGNTFVCPMPRSPSARSVPRCLGFVLIDDFTCVTLMAMSAHLGGDVRAPLALAVRVEHALGHEVFGVQASAAGNFIGPLQLPKALDRGAGHVDRVRRAKRLGQNVVDAGL